jgi:hypothetical protein
MACSVCRMNVVMRMTKCTAVVDMNPAIVDLTDWAEKHFEGFGYGDFVDLLIISH